MDNSSIDADTIRSMMIFAGGILSFSAVVTGIINAKLQKAKSVAAKERVISTAFSVASNSFLITSNILFLGFDASRAALWFFVLGTAVISIDYLRTTSPPSRMQTFILVLSWCTTTSIVVLYFFSRVLGIIAKLADALK